MAEFQSTLPTRGSDQAFVDFFEAKGWFQSTLPTRGSDKGFDDSNLTRYGVSIHAPHEGERHGGVLYGKICRCRFNPRSPRGGAT